MLYALIIGYCLVVLLVAVFQRRQLYFPSRLSPELAERTATAEGFVPWRNQAGQIIGWKMPANGLPTGSVLVVHGNGGNALGRGYIAKSIHAAGTFDVYVLEYPGYGARGGSPSLRSFLAAGDEAFELLPAALPAFVVGESLGTGVAAHLARKYPTKVAGLVLLVPYDDLGSVAQNQMPFLPARWLLRDHFRPSAWLTHYRGPIKVAVAENDRVIPARFGHRLYEAYAGPKQLQVFSGAGHNEVAEQSPEWWREVFAFWSANRPVGKTPE